MPLRRQAALRGRLALAAAIALAPASAAALPAVLVGAAPLKLRSHRSHLVIVDDGPRTVLTVQFDLLAVPMDLAVVLPIRGDVDPDSLQTLDRRLLDRLDHLAAPRLEHVWEQDPCAAPTPAPPPAPSPNRGPPATFQNGEYDFAVLGRIGAGELEAWLRERGFPMLEAHHAALAEHFAAGASFVVARVDRRQVHFDARGNAVLSPFRLAFTHTGAWALPLRAGLGHGLGVQDVVVHVLAAGPAVLGDPPAALVDGIALAPAAADRFASVYAAIFTRTRELRGTSTLLEHLGQLSDDALVPEERTALGLPAGPLILTRLHLQYAPAELPADPTLTITSPAAHDVATRLFVRHPWTGSLACAAPQRGVWGPPPPADRADDAAPRWVRALAPARPVADLAPLLADDVPALGLTATPAGCTCTADRTPRSPPVLAILLLLVPRRRRSR